LAEERKLLAELRTEWLDWSAALGRAALTRTHLAELDTMAGAAGRLREAGELGPLDARLFVIERATQAARLRGYEAAAAAAELGLKARLGLAPQAEVKLVPSLAVPSGAAPPAGDELPARLAAHPRVRVARAEYEAAEQALRLEIRKQYPDLTIGPGFGTDEGDERVLLGASLPLPILNANRRAIAEARAGRDVSRAAAEAEYEQLLAGAAAARARLEAARARVQYAEKELAPLADRQVEDARRLAQIGEFDALVLLEAVKAAHEARLEVLEARLDAASGSRRLEALMEGDESDVTGTEEARDDRP
jgi:CRISPR system Cascade subunit CasA